MKIYVKTYIMVIGPWALILYAQALGQGSLRMAQTYGLQFRPSFLLGLFRPCLGLGWARLKFGRPYAQP